MKFKIEAIEELTDSRLIMESKPNKFIYFFISLGVVFLIISFSWLWYAEKEQIVRVYGIIHLKEHTKVVSNEISGKIKEFNFKTGENINNGDIIYTLDDTEFLIKKEIWKIKEKN